MYKGDLKDFPPEIVEKMLWWQEQQGNKRDVTVFEKRKDSCSRGFDWDKTEEQFDFWNKVIKKNNFDLFFEKYPKQNVVCGVKLEQGKDYCFICKDGAVWLLRFCKIFNNEIYDLGAVNEGEYYNEEISWGDIKNIKSIRPATPKESEHLESCIKAGKYVEMKKYEYEVVHCETQEQWDFVIDKLQPNSFSKSWFKPDLGICFKNFQWCEIDWYKNRNSLILSFQEWCDKFGHTFEEEFKVGDWVVVSDDKALNEEIRGKLAIIINVSNNLVDIFISDLNKHRNILTKFLRKAVPHKIPQSLNLCQEIALSQHFQIDNRVCDKVSLQYYTGDEFKPITNLSLGNISLGIIPEQKPYYVKNKEVKQGLIVNIIEPKQVKQEVKLEPIKLNNHSRLKLK